MHEAVIYLQSILPEKTRYFVGAGCDVRTNSLLCIAPEDQANLLQKLKSDFFSCAVIDGFLHFTFSDDVLLETLSEQFPVQEIAFSGEESLDNPRFYPVYLIRRTMALCRLHGTDTSVLPQNSTARKLAVRHLLFSLLYADMTGSRKEKNINMLVFELSSLLSTIRFSEKEEVKRKLAVAKATAGMLSKLYVM